MGFGITWIIQKDTISGFNLLGIFLLAFPVGVSLVIHQCVIACSAICYDSLTPSDLYLKYQLFSFFKNKTKLAVTFVNSSVSADSHYWPELIFPRPRSCSSAPDFLPELKEKWLLLSFTLCICFSSNNFDDFLCYCISQASSTASSSMFPESTEHSRGLQHWRQDCSPSSKYLVPEFSHEGLKK